ncbi:hypothetical protein BLNAU_21257 [Blattamonas nauphoetae]|uniref:Uncharacterized protein n=1 Tax=Blattamonas nauphoetae TaxID=2049346 RepID=A0ABQ9WWE8_9EUKA|nr:hypothetical protein BLNAU_21257 [Blattamonas nauphoetae]
MVRANDIMFHHLPVWERVLKDKSSFVNCFSTSDFPRIALQLTHLIVDFSSFVDRNDTLLDIHLPTLGIAVSADAGSDADGSGSTYLNQKCRTVGFAGQNRLADADTSVVVESGRYEERLSIDVGSKAVLFSSIGDAHSVVSFTPQLGEDCFMQIGVGKLSLSNFSFVPCETASIVEVIGAGTLTIESCQFQNNAGLSPIVETSIIKMSDGTALLRKVDFFGIEFNQGSIVQCSGDVAKPEIPKSFLTGLGGTAGPLISFERVSEGGEFVVDDRCRHSVPLVLAVRSEDAQHKHSKRKGRLFVGTRSSQMTSEMIGFCDTTSGEPCRCWFWRTTRTALSSRRSPQHPQSKETRQISDGLYQPSRVLRKTSHALSFGQNQDGQNTEQTKLISEKELITLGESIVDGSGDPFAILHTICVRFGIAPKSISIDPRHQSNPSLFIHLFSALFTYLPNSTNFHLLPLFTTILQRHPPSLPHLLSSPLWLSLPSILASPPQSPQSLQTQPQPSPQPSPHNEPQIEEQSHLRPVLAFVNSILQLSLTSSPPTPIPNKTLLSSSLSTLSSNPDPLVKGHSGSALHFLTLLDGVVDETSMPLYELVAQRDELRTRICEKDGESTKMSAIHEHMKETMSANLKTINTLSFELHQVQTEIRKKDEELRQSQVIIREKEGTITSKDKVIAEKDAVNVQQTQQNKEKDKQLQMKDETIAELTKKLGEFVAMEKRLIDKPSTTHSKVVAVEAQVTEAAKDVKWIRGIVHPENVITVWDPTHFRKEGRRITSLVGKEKSCFSDEITRGEWRMTIRCDKYTWHNFGVIDSSKLEQSKTSYLYHQQGSLLFVLEDGSVHQNGKEIAHGNQKPTPNSVVTIELDMKRHTLVLFVDDQRQPHSLANIPQKVRFALYIYHKDRYADILSFDEVSARKE